MSVLNHDADAKTGRIKPVYQGDDPPDVPLIEQQRERLRRKKFPEYVIEEMARGT